jgi:two-component system chemotaxis sensor kinase CheA
VLRRARDEAEQREELSLCRRLSRDREGLFAFFEEARGIVERLSRPRSNPSDLLPDLHTLKGTTAMLGFPVLAEHCHEAEDAIRAESSSRGEIDRVVERFESLRRTLMSLAGHDAAQRVEVDRDALTALASRLEAGLSGKEAAEEVARLQLEPLARPLGRLGDHARALAARLGKGALEIEVDDGGALGDARSAAALWAVLVHLVRNAIDHGLESPDERRATGKTPDPRLWLSASEADGVTRIEIRDDGRGVDWERVRALAESRNLPASSRADLVQALFTPDLSTRAEVSSTSGRGVGLAAVQAELERLGGAVRVSSEAGEGCRFVVEVPTEAFGVRPAPPESERRPSIEIREGKVAG